MISAAGSSASGASVQDYQTEALLRGMWRPRPSYRRWIADGRTANFADDGADGDETDDDLPALESMDPSALGTDDALPALEDSTRWLEGAFVDPGPSDDVLPRPVDETADDLPALESMDPSALGTDDALGTLEDSTRWLEGAFVDLGPSDDVLPRPVG